MANSQSLLIGQPAPNSAALDAMPRCNAALGFGYIRVEPQDFQVEELFAPNVQRDGEYICVQVRKRNLNTRWVANGLARHFGVKSREVGWAGLKDRRAVTSQWFSIKARHLPLRPWFEPGTAWLTHCRVGNALRRGDHAGNRFTIRVRGLNDHAATEVALRAVRARGAVPNYFGAQRFGRDGGNLVGLRAWAQREVRPRDRFEQGMWLSAGRAWLFNLALANRVRAGDWQDVLAGDWVVAGVAAGPLWGDGRSLLQGNALRRCEQAWHEADWLTKFLAERRIAHGTRTWQLPIEKLDWRWQSVDDLTLTFQLGVGGFATTVLREILRLAPRESYQSGLVSAALAGSPSDNNIDREHEDDEDLDDGLDDGRADAT